MSFWSFLARLKWPEMPPAKDVANIPKQIKEASLKGESNTIYVKYLSASGPFASDTIGKVQRDTEIPICYVSIPEPMGFLMVPNSVRYNLTTHRNEVFLLEGYTAALALGDVYEDLRLQDAERNAFAAGKVDKDGFLFPVMPEELPRIPFQVEVNGQFLDITPKTMSQMGTAKWMDGMTDRPTSGVGVIFVLGAASGGFAALLLSAIAGG